jgi:hypothetical protein
LDKQFDNSLSLLVSIDDASILARVCKGHCSDGKSTRLWDKRNMRLCFPGKHSFLFDLEIIIRSIV